MAEWDIPDTVEYTLEIDGPATEEQANAVRAVAASLGLADGVTTTAAAGDSSTSASTGSAASADTPSRRRRTITPSPSPPAARPVAQVGIVNDTLRKRLRSV